MSAVNYGKIKVVKLFASSEYKSRNQAFRVVERLLRTREAGEGQNQLSSNDLISIWKGLYMWLWMQDKPILHEEVVGKICKLLSEISSKEVTINFMEGFFITMMREWKKIDIHRIDKFYMLSRDFLSACLNSLRSNELTEQFIETISVKVFNGVIDSGIEFKLHIIDILLDEFVRAECPEKLVTAVIMTAIRSMFKCSQKHVYVLRMKKRVIERLIPLFLEDKLNINFQEIGSNLQEIEKTEAMLGKMRKLCRGLSKGFLNCKKRNSPIIKVNEIENCSNVQEIEMECTTAAIEFISVETEMESTETEMESTETEMESAKTEIESTSAETEMEHTLAETEMESAKTEMESAETEMESAKTEIESAETEMESTSAETEMEHTLADIKNIQLPNPIKLTRTASKKQKLSKEIKTNDITEDKVVTKKRKVSFGKKYTKKFKKGEIDVSLSQGTTRNMNVKSILKKA